MDLTPWKILMIDNDEEDYQLTRQMLMDAKHTKITLDWASTFDQGCNLLLGDTYDAVLMDYDLGQHTGLELTRKAISSGCKTPIILYTGRVSYEIDVEAMQAGATLYLTKGETSALMLERCIRYAIEHKQIEQKLRESEARLKTILEVLPVGVGVLDAQGHLVESNSLAVQMWGAATKDMLPQEPEGYPSELAQNRNIGLREIVASKVLRGESFSNQEVTIQRFDGKMLPILSSASPIKDASGNLAGAVVTGVDISERKQMEQKLAESEEKARNLIRYAPVGIYEIDFYANRLISVNDTACQWLGYTREELMEIRPMDMLDEAGRALLQERIKKKLAGETLEESADYRLKTKDGRDFYVSLNASTFTYKDNKPISVLVVAHNITERKRIEQELIESEKKYRELIQYAPAGIYEVDFRTQRFTSVNDVMCQLTGYSREELLQLGPAALLDEQGMAQFKKRIAQWLGGERPDENVEYTVKTKDGRIIYAILSTNFTVDEHGKPLGATVVAFDISERKRAEALMEEHNRYAQEYSRRLELSNKELENFAFLASHDMQEPLRKIVTFSKQLVEKSAPHLNDTDRDLLERIQNAASRMSVIVDNLLALSRVTTRGKPFISVNLNTVLRDVQDDLVMRIRQTGGRIEVGYLPTILADAVQMHQLFQNLIANALKFHQPGQQPIVKVESKLVKPNLVEISVQDNGIGFDMAQVERLFQPFQRLRGRSEYEGTGIGLSICLKIVERHGGSITARSEPMQGATFIVRLPISR